MIISRYQKILLLIAALAIFLGACNKNTPKGINAQTATVGFILASSTNATVFESAVKRSQLDSVFTGTGPFTIFVPNNDACTNSGISQATLNGYTDSAVRNFVLYHTVAGSALTLANLNNARVVKIIMANGDSAYITSDTTHLYINGIPAQATDVLASNGIIQAIQQVLVPPANTLYQLIGADSSLTLLWAAVHRASETGIAYDSLLANAGPYTLFAPVNDAFRQASYFTSDDIEAANADSIAFLLNSHLIPLRYFACDLGEGSAKFNNNDSALNFTNNFFNSQVQLSGSDTISNITASNLMARNGVLFKIDQLLK